MGPVFREALVGAVVRTYRLVHRLVRTVVRAVAGALDGTLAGARVGCLVGVAILLAAGRVAHTAPEPAAAALADLRELPLADVVAVAVRQSPDLARARIDVDAARAALTRAQGSEDTHLGAQAQTDLIRASPDDPNGDFERDTVAASVSRALPTGGTLERHRDRLARELPRGHARRRPATPSRACSRGSPPGWRSG